MGELGTLRKGPAPPPRPPGRTSQILEGLVSFRQDLLFLASPSKHVPQFRPVHVYVDSENREALL